MNVLQLTVKRVRKETVFYTRSTAGVTFRRSRFQPESARNRGMFDCGEAPASGDYRVFPFAQLQDIDKVVLRDSLRVTDLRGLNITVQTSKDVVLELSLDDLSPGYYSGAVVKVAIAVNKFDPVYKRRQFPEWVRVRVQALDQKGKKPDPTINTTALIYDSNPESTRIFGNAGTSKFVIIEGAADPATPDLPANSTNTFAVNIVNGVGTINLMWVSSSPRMQASLAARLASDSENTVRSTKNITIMSWNDLIKLGPDKDLTSNSQIGIGNNKSYDWIDVMLWYTRKQCLDVNVADINSTFASFTTYSVGGTNSTEDALMWIDKTDVKRVLNIDPTSQSIRPAVDPDLAIRQRKFPSPVGPYINTLIHESRHAYITKLTLDPVLGNDVDGDSLPGKYTNGQAGAVVIGGDTTAAYTFNFPGPTDAIQSVIDPDPTHKQTDVFVPHTKVLFDLVQPPSIQNIDTPDLTSMPTVSYAFVYVLKPGQKLSMALGKNYPVSVIFSITGEKAFTAISATPNATVTYPKPCTAFTLTLSRINPELGQIELILKIGAPDASLFPAIKKSMLAATLVASFSSPPPDDINGRLELDAYTFAQLNAAKVPSP